MKGFLISFKDKRELVVKAARFARTYDDDQGRYTFTFYDQADRTIPDIYVDLADVSAITPYEVDEED